MVYVKEAHASDRWWLGRSRTQRHTPNFARPALHAALLGFEHPSTGERLRFETPLPEDMLALRGALVSREKTR